MFLKRTYMELHREREELRQHRLEISRWTQEGFGRTSLRSSLLEELEEVNKKINELDFILRTMSTRGGDA